MKISEKRVRSGLCPRCGNEAAPYYLCGRCRYAGLISRVLKKGEQYGAYQRSKSGRTNLWRRDNLNTEWSYLEAQPGDGRLKPRLGRIPVDVEASLDRIFAEAKEPLTLDEINAAWGKLRLRSQRTSAAQDLAHIIRSDRKRKAKMERRIHRLQGGRSELMR